MPHWEAEDATYFLTFRLRDSLPADIVVNLKRERAHLIAKARTAAERIEANRAFGRRLDSFLDLGYGSGLLRQHGGVVRDALQYFDGSRYELQAWCVMPNHVHALFFVPGRADLDKILHSWKSFTSHRIELGVIWAREYCDHVIRGPGELARIRDYIRENPVKAGLVDWPFVG